MAFVLKIILLVSPSMKLRFRDHINYHKYMQELATATFPYEMAQSKDCL